MYTDGPQLKGADFAGTEVHTDKLFLSGSRFLPSEYERVGGGYGLELVTETEDQVDIDGRLKVGEVLLEGTNALLVDKQIETPGIVLDGVSLLDHFRLEQ